MKTGDKVGFEVKDDVHIERADGKIILLQAKHTVSTDSEGNTSNLTTLDSDLWKTLSRWASMIKADPTILENHTFCLVTNKVEYNNKFIEALEVFNTDGNIKSFIEKIEELRSKTKDEELSISYWNLQKSKNPKIHRCVEY